MYDKYFESFNSKVPLTPEEQELIRTHLTVKKLRKRQYLLQEGDVCKCVAFVEKGALRLYRVIEATSLNGPSMQQTLLLLATIRQPD